jgi:hypothetical protein
MVKQKSLFVVYKSCFQYFKGVRIMKKLLFLLCTFFLAYVSVEALADKGNQKNSEVVREKVVVPEVVVEESRVCGWTESAFVHTEQGTSYNYGVSSFGSGVWGLGYNSYPATKAVHTMTFSCGPKKINNIVSGSKQGGKDE